MQLNIFGQPDIDCEVCELENRSCPYWDAETECSYCGHYHDGET